MVSSMRDTFDEFFRDFDGSYDKGMLAFAAVFGLVFLFIVTMIVLAVVRGLLARIRNSRAPVLTVPAVLVGKRQELTGGSEHRSTTTWYYATFELPGHDRVELAVRGHEWGVLVEGDRGRLTYQGTRYRGFDRTPADR